MPCRAVRFPRIRDVHATSTRERRVIHRFIVAPAHRARARTHDVARVTRMNESRDDVDTSPAPRPSTNRRRFRHHRARSPRARCAPRAQPFSRIRTFALEHVPRVASTLHTRRNDGWMDGCDAMRCARARPPGGVDARRPCVMRVRRSRDGGGGGGRTRSGRVLTNGQVASGRVRTPPRSLASPASRRPVALCRRNDPSASASASASSRAHRACEILPRD